MVNLKLIDMFEKHFEFSAKRGNGLDDETFAKACDLDREIDKEFSLGNKLSEEKLIEYINRARDYTEFMDIFEKYYLPKNETDKYKVLKEYWLPKAEDDIKKADKHTNFSSLVRSEISKNSPLLNTRNLLHAIQEYEKKYGEIRYINASVSKYYDVLCYADNAITKYHEQHHRKIPDSQLSLFYQEERTLFNKMYTPSDSSEPWRAEVSHKKIQYLLDALKNVFEYHSYPEINEILSRWCERKASDKYYQFYGYVNWGKDFRQYD